MKNISCTMRPPPLRFIIVRPAFSSIVGRLVLPLDLPSLAVLQPTSLLLYLFPITNHKEEQLEEACSLGY
ncbi:unnamed protein product [Victoria cruziana]